MPSQKQMEYLAYAWQCFDSDPKIDYESFRALFSLSSTASAREVLRVAKKALREDPQPPGTPTKAAFLAAKPNAFAALSARNAEFRASQRRVENKDGEEEIQYTKTTPRKRSATGEAQGRKQYIATPIKPSPRGGGKMKIGMGTASGAKRVRQVDAVRDEDVFGTPDGGENGVSPSVRVDGKRVKMVKEEDEEEEDETMGGLF